MFSLRSEWPSLARIKSDDRQDGSPQVQTANPKDVRQGFLLSSTNLDFVLVNCLESNLGLAPYCLESLMLGYFFQI